MTKIKAETVVEIPASIYALDAMTLRVVKFWLDVGSPAPRSRRWRGYGGSSSAAGMGSSARVCVCVWSRASCQ